MSLANYSFREANEEDFDGIEELFERFDHSPKPNRGWAEWKYGKNPDGHARIFIAENSEKTIVATLAHIARQFENAGDEPLVVMSVVDMFVSPNSRKDGVFLGLLTYAAKRMDIPKLGSPNEVSRNFGTLQGWSVLAPRESWHFPVRAGRMLANSQFGFLAPVANMASRIYHALWLGITPRDIEMRPVVRFETDYRPTVDHIHGRRTAEYLNWRFIDNPIGKYSVFEFVKANEPIGFCAYAKNGDAVVIADFVAQRNQRGCLKLLVNHCFCENFARMSFTGAGLGLRKFGFLYRTRTGDFYQYKLPDGQWIVTGCDTDSEVDRGASVAG